MSYLLDTSIAIPLRDDDQDIRARVEALDRQILLSVVTRVELEGGVHRNPAERTIRRARLDTLLATLPVVDFDEASAEAYRRIVEVAGYSRRKLLDRMIAAQAIVHGAVLITANAADFRDVPGLSVLDWG